MPPFTYQGYTNPFVQSISSLLEQPGQIEAQRAQTIGNAQANAALQGGQAWGGAIQGAGQAVSGAIQQATDPRRQMEQIQVDLAKKSQAYQAATNGIVSNLMKQNPDGTRTIDRAKLAQQLAASNVPLAMQKEVFTSLDDVDKSVQSFNTLRTDHRADFAHAALSSALGKTPEGVLALAGIAKANGMVTDEDLQPIYAALAQGHDPKAILEGIRGFSEKYKDVNKPIVLPPTPEGAAPAKLITPSGEQIATGGQSQAKPPTETEVAMKAAGGDAAAAMSLLKPKPVESAQSVDKLLDGKPTTLMFDPKTKQYTNASGQVIENAATRIKPIPSASAIALNAGNLSDVALEQAAQKYLETGILPPGFGTAGVLQKTAIMNKAALLDPKAALARNQAVFKADQANLTKLQTTEGTLSAFERTAGKNLDQFLTTAAKVPDTGVPWINAPIRTLNAKLLGSADQAAFNAARDVALREIARVTNDPKLSGALTDSARAEVSALSPATATFAQIKRVAQILKQDMANVHSGLTEQIASVKSGIGQNPNAAAPAEAPRVRKYNPATGKLE